jgi:GMP synthase (glutamine-hydrolysing)
VTSILIVQHEEHAPLCSLEPPLVEQGHSLEVWRPDLGEPVPQVSAFDGVISLGGVAHPDQDSIYPWLAGERSLLRAAIDLGVPTLGVCLGSQLLAQAAGGAAGPSEDPEIGWCEVRLTDAAQDDSLLGGLPASFPAFEWHHYRFSLPPGATLLAVNESANQGFAFGDCAWGLQFHIEVDDALAHDWIAGGAHELVAHGIDRAGLEQESTRQAPAYARLAHHVAGRFGEVVTARAEARAALLRPSSPR